MSPDQDLRFVTPPAPSAEAAPAPHPTAGNAKIFGIGLSKTGTSSLAHALDTLGFRVKDNMGVSRYSAGDLACLDLALVDANDALTDTPIPSFYRELDTRHPGSKFILTVRDSAGWLKSCKKQFTAAHAAQQSAAHERLFRDLYDCTVFDAEKFAHGYERFVRGVMAYFADRPQDLLVIDIAAGEGWEKLCPFVDRRVPDQPFPKTNVTQIRWIDIDSVVAIARQAGREIVAHLERYPAAAPSADSASGLWGRAIALFGGREASPAKRARRISHRTITEGLQRLRAPIPVVSPEGPLAPITERRSWNHLWLIDPLDDAGSESGDALAVSIALIEDGRPIYGVVYDARNDTAYFARAGKGSYKMGGDGAPRLLGQARDGHGADAPTPRPTNGSRQASSLPLLLCRLAEGGGEIPQLPDSSREWETAAADVVLRGAGFRLHDGESGDDLLYNKPDLVNRRLDLA